MHRIEPTSSATLQWLFQKSILEKANSRQVGVCNIKIMGIALASTRLLFRDQFLKARLRHLVHLPLAQAIR